jgi:hypothetical protein
MKRIARWLPVVLVAMLALVPVLPALAQGGTNPVCNGLSESDCAILESPAQNTVTSFVTPSWEIRLNFSDGTQTVAFSAKGSGGFSFTDGQIVVHLVIDESSLEAPDTPSMSGSAEVIVTNDMAYVNYNGEWYGQAVTPEDLQSMGLGNVADLSGMMSGGVDLSSTGIDLTGVLTTTRGADAESMGQKMADFNTSVDINGLLTAVLSSPLLGEALGAAGGAGDSLGLGGMTPEDMQMMGMFLGPLLAGTTISFEQWIGLDDSQIHMIKLDIPVSLDLSMLAPEVGKITGEVYFMSEVAAHNQPVEVTPPASYKPMDELQTQLDSLTSTLGM